MMTGAVRNLYFACWGEPSRKAAFRVAGLEVEVCKWERRAREGMQNPLCYSRGAPWPLRAAFRPSESDASGIAVGWAGFRRWWIVVHALGRTVIHYLLPGTTDV